VDIAAGSFFALFYRVLGMFFWMLLGVITARALSVEDRGAYVATVVVVQSVASVAASFGSASGYFVSNKRRDAAEVAANGALLSAILGGLLLVVCLAAVPFLEGQNERIAVLMGLAMFPIVARSALGGVFLGVNAIGRYNFSVHGPAYAAVAAMVVWVVLLEHRTLEDALGAWIFGQYVSLLLLAFMGLGWWSWLIRHRPDTRLIKNIITFGAMTGLAGFISFFNYRIDLLLVAGLDGREGAGIYSTAVALAEGLWLFSTALSIATYAAIGQLDRSEAAALTARGFRHTLLAVGVAALGVIVVAPVLITILFGDRYEGATTSLRILAVGTALFAPLALLSNYFTVQLGRPSISLALAFCSLVVNIALSAVLIPRIGYVGGAWGTLVSYTLTAVAAIIIFLRLSDARLQDLWRIRRDDLASYFRLGRRVMSGQLFGRA
jgi:O-antigen/teichoic acid export membrane protein